VQPHPNVPHVTYAEHPRGGFVVMDTRTGEQAWAPDAHAVNQFAADHAAKHGYYGAGDAVAALARPLANAIGLGGRDCGCAERQTALNRAFPSLWPRR
jgi:hypothetical protein